MRQKVAESFFCLDGINLCVKSALMMMMMMMMMMIDEKRVEGRVSSLIINLTCLHM